MEKVVQLVGSQVSFTFYFSRFKFGLFSCIYSHKSLMLFFD